MEKEKKSKIGKIIKGCLTVAGSATVIGCVYYVGKEVKKEFDDTVDENNRLREFINSHDFYEKQQSMYRSNDYDSSNDEESKERKFDPNNPVYKQSASTMRKMGLNPDGTPKTKAALVKLEEESYISHDGYIVDVWEDVASGLKIYKPTNRKASEEDEKEA